MWHLNCASQCPSHAIGGDLERERKRRPEDQKKGEREKESVYAKKRHTQFYVQLAGG